MPLRRRQNAGISLYPPGITEAGHALKFGALKLFQRRCTPVDDRAAVSLLRDQSPLLQCLQDCPYFPDPKVGAGLEEHFLKAASSDAPGAPAGYGVQNQIFRPTEEYPVSIRLLSGHICGKIAGGEGPALMGETDILRHLHQLPHIAGPAIVSAGIV